jgi:hypothetical protein
MEKQRKIHVERLKKTAYVMRAKLKHMGKSMPSISKLQERPSLITSTQDKRTRKNL